eukprot:8526402-Alexandrium_andersonii.AAC.1
MRFVRDPCHVHWSGSGPSPPAGGRSQSAGPPEGCATWNASRHALRCTNEKASLSAADRALAAS